MSDDSIVQQHGGTILSGFFSLIGTVLVFLSRTLVKREVAHLDERHEVLKESISNVKSEHGQRIVALENRVATKDDIRELSRTMEDRHQQIVNILTNSQR